MKKTILITGSTDGIGALTAKMLAAKGHEVILHGRNEAKLAAVAAEIGGEVMCLVADLSSMEEVEAMAAELLVHHTSLDVLINNAGVFKTSREQTPDGLDVRFMVNTIAPYALTQRLLPIIPATGRVVNLSSAAQAAVNLDALAGRVRVSAMSAYAQSKLAITIWSMEMARALPDGPVIVAVNPGSLLATKMVEEGFGVAGNDLSIGANILCEAALGESFASASGRYFDNDSGRFAAPNAAALNAAHVEDVMRALTDVTRSLQ